jgi:hypothetical protein
MPAADIAGTLRFDPVANGTRMGWSWVVRPRGLYRLLTLVIVRVGRHQEQESWGGLKRFLEAREELAPEAPDAAAARQVDHPIRSVR